MTAETINKIDFGKIAMGVSVAIIFALQQWHAMKLEEIRATVVPRSEYQQNADKVMDKDEIMDAFEDFSRRLSELEKK